MNYSYLALLFKAVGATYACEFCAGICKDAGYQAVAVQIEIFGKLAVLVLSIPVLLALLTVIKDFLS